MKKYVTEETHGGLGREVEARIRTAAQRNATQIASDRNVTFVHRFSHLQQ